MDILKVINMLRVSNIPKSAIKYNLPHLSHVFCRQASTAGETKQELYARIEDEDYETTILEKEQKLEQSRNKSRLREAHRNMLHGRLPYSEPCTGVHYTLKYKRRMFGRYGAQSNINPGTLWPNTEEIRKTIEYENIAYPYSIQESVDRQIQKIQEENNAIRERQEKIFRNLKKLDEWKKDIEQRAAKKLADLAKAKAKKDALIEETRKHFGYKVDPNEEKFKEVLAQKEKAQKKKLKEEKAKAKHERLLEDLMKKES